MLISTPLCGNALFRPIKRKCVHDIWEYAQQVAKDEDDLPPEPPTKEKIDSESVKATVEKLNDILSGRKDISPKSKAKLRYINKNYPVNIKNMKNRKKSWAKGIVIVKLIQRQRLCE